MWSKNVIPRAQGGRSESDTLAHKPGSSPRRLCQPWALVRFVCRINLRRTCTTDKCQVTAGTSAAIINLSTGLPEKACVIEQS